MRFLVSLLTACAVAVPPLAAQPEPPRPKLPADLDTNDARDYYAWTLRRSVDWKAATNAYYWAVRLEPDNPIWLFARYRGLWFRQPAEWRRLYAEGAKFVVKTKEAKAIDSLLGEVLLRDPFPHFLTPCYLADGLERHRDRALVGLIHYENGCYRQAVEAFGQALAKDASLLVLHVYRARAFFFQRAYDRTIGELTILLDSLRARDERHLVHWYDSKEMFEYMIGMAEWRAGRLPGAREAFGRALTEDLSFYMAHARLGAIARELGNRDQAVAEYEVAVGLKPEDGVLRREYGAALLEAGRFADAEAELREAMRLEPHWALPYFDLGVTLEELERPADALAAFQTYLARAPRRAGGDIGRARTYVQRLEQRMAATR